MRKESLVVFLLACAVSVCLPWPAGASPQNAGSGGETAALLRGLTGQKVQFTMMVGGAVWFENTIRYAQTTFRFVREGFFIIDARRREISFIPYSSIDSVSIRDFQEGMSVLSGL